MVPGQDSRGMLMWCVARRFPLPCYHMTHSRRFRRSPYGIIGVMRAAIVMACASPLVFAAVAQPRPTVALTGAMPEYGPTNGSLVIVGGGNLEGTGISEKFIAMAGGANARIVVVPTAGGNRKADGSLIPYVDSVVLASWLKSGVTNVRMLHTADPKVADTEEFANILRDATGVWFNGGRQWNIVDSYAGTRTFREFHNVLTRGGVIGGSSAGATIQGAYLVRGAISGADVMMAPEPEHQNAFGFLRRSAIDQHINTRNRWDDLDAVIARFPTLLGIGLSEGTAILVNGDRFDIIGKAQVAIHDNTKTYAAGAKPYILLKAGDAYDMHERKVLLGTAMVPPVK